MLQFASPYSLYTALAHNTKNVFMLIYVIFMQIMIFVAMYVLTNKIIEN